MSLLVTGIFPRHWQGHSLLCIAFGVVLAVVALRRSERVAVFPAAMFLGTGLLQRFFGSHSFVWLGDVLVAYLLVGSISTLLFSLVDSSSLRYWAFAMILAIGAAVLWCTKRFVWPWHVLPQITWWGPLAFVFAGLAWSLAPVKRSARRRFHHCGNE